MSKSKSGVTRPTRSEILSPDAFDQASIALIKEYQIHAGAQHRSLRAAALWSSPDVESEGEWRDPPMYRLNTGRVTARDSYSTA